MPSARASPIGGGVHPSKRDPGSTRNRPLATIIFQRSRQADWCIPITTLKYGGNLESPIKRCQHSAPDLRWPPSGKFGEIRRLLQPTPHARRQPPIKAFVGSSHRLGPRPQRPQDLMARRYHHAERGDGGICTTRLDRTRLADRQRFHALSADAVRRLGFRFIGLIIFWGEVPIAASLKFVGQAIFLCANSTHGRWGVSVPTSALLPFAVEQPEGYGAQSLEAG